MDSIVDESAPPTLLPYYIIPPLMLCALATALTGSKDQYDTY